MTDDDGARVNDALARSAWGSMEHERRRRAMRWKKTLRVCGHDRGPSQTKRDRHVALYEVALALMVDSESSSSAGSALIHCPMRSDRRRWLL